MRREVMKKLVVILAIVLFSVPCFAGELEELKLRKQNLELALQNIQLQMQILNQQFIEGKRQLSEVDASIKAKEPKKPEVVEKKK